MNESDSAFESELRGLKPAPPSLSLEGRIAAALPAPPPRRPSRVLWLSERMLWTAAGALASWLMVVHVPSSSPKTAPAPAVAQADEAASRMSEEAVAWSDDGVKLIDGDTPARMLRRLVMERHRSADGTAELHVPREDVFLVPVALR